MLCMRDYTRYNNQYKTNFERFIQATMNKILLQKNIHPIQKKINIHTTSLNGNSIDCIVYQCKTSSEAQYFVVMCSVLIYINNNIWECIIHVLNFAWVWGKGARYKQTNLDNTQQFWTSTWFFCDPVLRVQHHHWCHQTPHNKCGFMLIISSTEQEQHHLRYTIAICNSPTNHLLHSSSWLSPPALLNIYAACKDCLSKWRALETSHNTPVSTAIRLCILEETVACSGSIRMRWVSCFWCVIRSLVLCDINVYVLMTYSYLKHLLFLPHQTQNVVGVGSVPPNSPWTGRRKPSHSTTTYTPYATCVMSCC